MTVRSLAATSVNVCTLEISAVVIDLQIANNNGKKLDKDTGNWYYPSEERI